METLKQLHEEKIQKELHNRKLRLRIKDIYPEKNIIQLNEKIAEIKNKREFLTLDETRILYNLSNPLELSK